MTNCEKLLIDVYHCTESGKITTGLLKVHGKVGSLFPPEELYRGLKDGVIGLEKSIDKSSHCLVYK